MEGKLYHWVGYIYGFQERYYVLENTSLHCYVKKDDVINKSKPVDTLNVPLCEIVRDNNTKLQFEIKKPDGYSVYFKTETEKERQTWLRSLGSAKACMLNTTSFDYLTHTSSVKTSNNNEIHETKSDSNLKTSANSSGESDISIIEKDEIISGKLEENIEEKDTNKEQNNKNLDENQVMALSLTETEYNNSEEISIICNDLKEKISQLQSEVFSERCSSKSINGHLQDCDKSFSELKSCIDGLFKTDVQSENSEEITDATKDAAPPVQEKDCTAYTFWTNVEVSFKDVLQNAALRSDDENLENGIETALFLNACECFMVFYDRFGGTVMAPMKADVAGNINKITKIFKRDEEKYFLIQDLLCDSAFAANKMDSSGPIEPLVWLLRGFSLMSEFLLDLCNPSSERYRNTHLALDYGYQVHLMQYHNWAVKKMFRLGMRMCPSYESFVEAMSEESLKSKTTNEIQEIVERDSKEFAIALSRIIKCLQKFTS